MSEASPPVKVVLMSFGFKYGLPPSNYYFDVGFIKNPAREQRWNFFSGLDQGMIDYVLTQEKVQEFITRALPLIVFLTTIDQKQIFAFGCNSGRHRSPILVDELSRRLREEGILHQVVHRDMED